MRKPIPFWHRLRKGKNAVLDLDDLGRLEYQDGMSRLRTLRLNAGLSQAKLAHMAGTSQPQIKRLEADNGDKRKLTKEWAVRLAPHLGVTPEQLLFESISVPIVGYVSAGGEASFFSEGHGFSGEEAPRPPGASPDTVALQVRGGSMPGVAEDKWLVYYDEKREPITDDLIGELCVVGLADGRVVVKKVYRGRDEGRFDLVSIAHEDLRSVEIEWAAKVEWIKPR